MNRKNLIELGVYTIRKKGLTSFTLAAPKIWIKYSRAKLGDAYVALTDKRDNSLHFYPTKRTEYYSRRPT